MSCALSGPAFNLHSRPSKIGSQSDGLLHNLNNNVGLGAEYQPDVLAFLDDGKRTCSG